LNLKNILIIQPWFTAKGHPAQSLLNTARALEPSKNVRYLISLEAGKEPFVKMSQELSEFATLKTFHVNSSSLQEGTWKSFIHLFRSRKALKDTTILFLDGHLVVFALCWLFLRFWICPKRIGLLYLKGPERIHGYWLTKKLTSWLLGLNEFVLYLRTEELEKDWKSFFSNADERHIRTIPSLELSVGDFSKLQSGEIHSKQPSFAVIGQIRKGKGLDWLVPLFQKNPKLGKLTVAGTFYNAEEEKTLPQLEGFEGFRNEFLSESEMLSCAIEQDYLIMLYDDWDARMESAILYLAAKVRRPVIAYNRGWCGRKVAMFGCGVLLPDHCNVDFESVLSLLPKHGSKEYTELLEGVDRFVQAHSGEVAKTEFLRALLE